MNELALFAGAGGGILGGKLLGWRTLCAVELDAYARRVLLHRQRDGHLDRFPIWDDVRTFDGRPWKGSIGCVSAGWPCQDISTIGTGEGITGAKSGLWVECARIIREVEPVFCLLENSPAITVRGLGSVLRDLAQMGFNAEWGVLGAHHSGAPHKRERVWILGTHTQRNRLERFKQGRTEKATTNRPSKRNHSLWWSDQPSVLRVADGVAHRVDRLRAIGNGQVPAVAALAWRTLVND